MTVQQIIELIAARIDSIRKEQEGFRGNRRTATTEFELAFIERELERLSMEEATLRPLLSEIISKLISTTSGAAT